MIELHYYPSNASFAPHILLEEMGIPYTLRQVDRANNEHKSPAYLKLNPNGLIPTLVDGDLVLYETAAILMHLADCHPGFCPAPGTPQRAQYYKWMVWLTNTLQAMLIHYFYPDRMASDAAEVKARAEAQVAPMLDQMDAELARHGGPWFLGETYSAVDPLAFMLCRWTRMQARPAKTRPALGAYLQRVFERPATQRVVAKEKLPDPVF
ncbi:glutathione S-transferase family protein [Roseateles puraquae]|jgi:glutathione S-transferase|uniref:Glutathione S-transferase n=1 Tax=Roseateles puraquae TaxID=431059 RepID=A0A254NDT9_9BURK|nr:glutathione S-transferase family protein [Roseateles puraquae]MDG0854871.1 glutathione S-transferase family protein [Roseateles puraquae]OWR04547.1 glutathione S-transferase [Roseateles puraquae]